MKSHKILDKNIILGTIILALICLAPSQTIAVFSLGNKAAMGFFAAFGSIISLAIFKLIFKGEFIGFIKGGEHRTGIRLACLGLIYYAFLMFQTLFFGEFKFPGLVGLATACAAGVCEEALFRGYFISFWLRSKNNEKYIPAVLIASSLLFGLSHSFNIFGGAGLAITIFQVIGTIGIGALLAAIYLRSGNLLIVMIVHGLTDFIAFMDNTQVSEAGVMVAHIRFINFVDLLFCATLAAIAFYLIRPSKRAEIVALWNRKWNR